MPSGVGLLGKMHTQKTSKEVWGTNALEEAINAYRAKKPVESSLNVINKLHALCMVMVDKIMNLEAANVALLAEKTQAKKNFADMKKDRKKEKDSCNKTQGETKGKWAAQKEEMLDKINALENDLKLMQSMPGCSQEYFTVLRDIKCKCLFQRRDDCHTSGDG